MSPVVMSSQSRPHRRLGLALLLVVCSALPFGLAYWQWQRGESRSAALAAFDQAALRPAVPFPNSPSDVMPGYQRVAIHGMPAGPALLLANSYRDEMPGVRVIEPYRLEDGTMMLVEQGWQAQAQARQPLPTAMANPTGRWVPLPVRFTLSGAHIAAEGVTDALDLPMLVRRFNAPVRNGLLVEEPTPAPLKPWPIRPPYEPARNYSYALQWVLIGVGFLVAAGFAWKGRHGKS